MLMLDASYGEQFCLLADLAIVTADAQAISSLSAADTLFGVGALDGQNEAALLAAETSCEQSYRDLLQHVAATAAVSAGTKDRAENITSTSPGWRLHSPVSCALLQRLPLSVSHYQSNDSARVIGSASFGMSADTASRCR
jgi:hypothetical protein